MPSLTPAGILIGITSSSITLPSPLQVWQVSVTIFPSPLQLGHVLLDTIWPSIVFTTFLTCPFPPHMVQVCKEVPFFAPFPLHVPQVTCLFTLIFFSTPLAISSRFNLSLIRRFDPFLLRDCPPPEPPPKKLSN